MLTRKSLRSTICGPFYLDGFFSGYVSDAGASNQLIDTNYDGIQDIAYDSDRFENSYVYVPRQLKADGFTIRGEEEQRVLSYEPASGLITIGRDFAVDLEEGAYYEIHSHGLSPRSVNRAIDWACSNSRQDVWFMLGGGLFDGDMQYADIAYWSTSGTNISAYKEIYSNESIAKRILTTVNYLPNEYMYQTIATTPGRTYKIYASVRSSSKGTVDFGVKENGDGSVVAGIECTYTTIFGGTPANNYDYDYPIEIVWSGNSPTSPTGIDIVASVSGDSLVVTSTSGTIRLGMYVVGDGLTTNTRIVSTGTALGGVGTYTINNSVGVIASAAMTITSGIYQSDGLSEELWGGQLTIPDDCYAMKVRLYGSGNWSAVAVYDTQAQEIPWPGFLSPADQYAIAFGYYPYYGRDATTAGVVGINAPPRPDAGSWSIVPAQYPGPLAVRAAAPFPLASLDEDSYPSNVENYLLAGAYRFLSTQLSRPDTMDNTRFEMLRMKAERDWQAHSMSRNPLARSRPVYGRSRQ